MFRSDKRCSRSVHAAIVLGGVVLGGMTVAGEREKEPTPIEQLNRDLLGMQRNISSSNMKVERRMAGVAPLVNDDGTTRQPTVAEACCMPHIERINKKIGSMTRTVDRLDLEYAGAENSRGLTTVNEIRTQLTILSQGMSAFKTAESQQRAQQALQGLIRPFNRLRGGIETLQECCPVEKFTRVD